MAARYGVNDDQDFEDRHHFSDSDITWCLKAINPFIRTTINELYYAYCMDSFNRKYKPQFEIDFEAIGKDLRTFYRFVKKYDISHRGESFRALRVDFLKFF